MEIASVAEWVNFVNGLSWAMDSHAHVRTWFRGQANSEWPLAPGVYRSDEFPATTEDQRLKLERHLSQDFRVRSAGLLDHPKSDMELYFLQQHYGMPARLLDWTSNAFTFAFPSSPSNVSRTPPLSSACR